MKKKELIWTIIRLLGLLGIYMFIEKAVALVVNLYTFMQIPELFEKSFGIIFQTGILMILYGVVGIYLLIDGNILFTILNREDYSNSLEKDLEETSFNLNNKQNI